MNLRLYVETAEAMTSLGKGVARGGTGAMAPLIHSGQKQGSW